MESVHVRARQFHFLTLRLIERVEVACDAEMAACIGSVGGDIYLDDGVVLKLIESSCRRTNYSIGRQFDDAINAANANEGTDRFLIFVPDGEYQLTGFESLEGRYNITSDGAWPCDEDGKAVTKDEMESKYNYQNGMTLVSRPNVSIIGPIRSSPMLNQLPLF